MDTKYNGWTNYETWNAALWMDNSGDQEYYQDVAKQCREDENGNMDDATSALAERMKDDHEERAEEWMSDQASMFADILNAGLRCINWHEIARHYIEELETEEA